METKRMIVKTARDIQGAGSDLLEYLRVIDVAPSAFGEWTRRDAVGQLVEPPPRPMTQEETDFRINLRHELKQLAHMRHLTFGAQQLWRKYRGRITRDEFRKLAREVRAEATRERLAGLLRYEFTHPDDPTRWTSSPGRAIASTAGDVARSGSSTSARAALSARR
jgi:hypothetical protein